MNFRSQQVVTDVVELELVELKRLILSTFSPLMRVNTQQQQRL